jgi:hypothetical protein
MSTTRTHALVFGAAALAVAASGVDQASAQTRYQAREFTFVGTAAQCGGTAGSNIVTASWLAGMGLPDDGSPNPDGRNAHQGLLLSKNGPTPNCSSAGAEIVGWTSGDTLSALGFDFRRGGHCGAGAPRFNVTDTSGNVYFFGCAGGTHSPAPQDPAQWERVRFTTSADGSPATFVFGMTPVASIDILFDEGTDTANNDTEGVGLAVLDNIRINETTITMRRGNRIVP